MSDYVRGTARLVDCPHCEAAPGEPCRKFWGRRTHYSHEGRKRRAVALAALAGSDTEDREGA